ncbi:MULTISPECIES: hypothetical protein [Streptomyces]|uniref:hypothetical protein n=1 Tax=Streptomyces TaxID=1883 RepID=UPI000FB920AA|nr:hypothetical protein [Streptomyces sp. WAC06128]RSS67722.1 hypothetical protein EF911_34990 [Streptomyces sp. WAC06128]
MDPIEEMFWIAVITGAVCLAAAQIWSWVWDLWWEHSGKYKHRSDGSRTGSSGAGGEFGHGGDGDGGGDGGD